MNISWKPQAKKATDITTKPRCASAARSVAPSGSAGARTAGPRGAPPMKTDTATIAPQAAA